MRKNVKIESFRATFWGEGFTTLSVATLYIRVEW